MSTTTDVELRSNVNLDTNSQNDQTNAPETNDQQETEPGLESTNIAEAVPDGGYGWLVVAGSAIVTFWFNGLTASWGIIQTALLGSSLQHVPTSTITFVGSLGLALCVVLSLLSVRMIGLVGARITAMLGVLLLGVGEVASGFTTSNIGGLFGTSGVLVGLGTSLCYCISNTTPNQYFSAKLGLANGLVKLGGGLGAVTLSLSLEGLIRRVGISWMFRILGLLTLSTGLPAAWLVKERTPLRNAPFAELSMFKSLPFVAIFFSSAIGTFALFVPPYFLPLFAHSVGLPPSTGAGVVAAFSACNAIGRFAAGPMCDRVGPLNTFVVVMLLNAVSMLAIWPVSESLGPLVVFALINGVANGAFFTTLPTVVASMVGPGRAAVAMSLNVTGWTGGYLLGTPIAGYLLQAFGGDQKRSIDPYRPAIFYAGGVAFASSACVLLARLKMDRKIVKKV